MNSFIFRVGKRWWRPCLIEFHFSVMNRFVRRVALVFSFVSFSRSFLSHFLSCFLSPRKRLLQSRRDWEWPCLFLSSFDLSMLMLMLLAACRWCWCWRTRSTRVYRRACPCPCRCPCRQRDYVGDMFMLMMASMLGALLASVPSPTPLHPPLGNFSIVTTHWQNKQK